MHNILESTLAASLKAQSFSKKRLCWRRKTDDTIIVVDLQRSQWGEQYYLNVAVAPKLLDPPESPKEHQCDVRVRIDEVRGDAEVFQTCFDLENDQLTDEDRRRIVGIVFADSVEPLIQLFATLDGVAKYVRSPESRGALVSLKLRTALAIPET